MHTQTYPTPWNNFNPKTLLGQTIIPGPTCVTTCEECVEPLYPSTEITSQCTEKCVVIACSDPEHSDVNPCDGTGNVPCDLVCNETTNCTDCDGFDQFLQCCTNYHSYQPRNDGQFFTFPWESSLNDFFCSCTEAGDLSFSRNYPTFDSSGIMGPLPISHTPADLDVQLMPPPLSPPSSSSSHCFVPSPSSICESELLTCMWGQCQATFTSLGELVGHVNLEHLRLPPNEPQQPTDVTQKTPNVPQLTCQWRDCSVYPSLQSIPNSSSGDHVNDIVNILADHLLHDHLGMDTPRIPSPMVRGQANRAREPSVSFTETTSTSGSVSPLPNGGTHTCMWRSCRDSFSSYEDLTTHITVVHVGGGKAQYECFWQGCNRNGDHGFSSKQKICRHIQSHTGHRPHQCAICNQFFSEPATLQQHMRRHTQEKPYICDYPGCGKSFAITGALTIHKRIHNGQKPFKCKFCDRAFAESSNLSKHLRTHTGARPYYCAEPGCNKSFARPDQLTRHMGTHKKKSAGKEEQTADCIP